MVPTRFATKQDAREHVWQVLRAERQAAFPFPIHGRIPNFKGARQAAERLMRLPVLAEARCIKVNPDAPQRPVRALALARGITVVVPTPRLRGGFMRLDPAAIPPERYAEAASMSKADRWASALALTELPRVDAIVTGCVAVTRNGRRCGKGHGYGDIEHAILYELGQPPVPVVTSVHSLQVLDAFPAAAHDAAVHYVVTADEAIATEAAMAPAGIDWDRLPAGALADMPVLEELRRVRGRARRP